MNGASAMEKLVGLFVYLYLTRKAALDFKAMYLRVRFGARLLEIGCGSGRQLEFLRQLGWRVEGLDLDPVAVKVASARGLTVHTGSLKEQNFPDQYFDAVVSSHVIEHVHDPIGLLRECGRVLRPGGKLVVITPNTASWGNCGFVVTGLLSTPPASVSFQPSLTTPRCRKGRPCGMPPHLDRTRCRRAIPGKPRHPEHPSPCLGQPPLLDRAPLVQGPAMGGVASASGRTGSG